MTKKVALCVQIPEDIGNLLNNLGRSLGLSKTQVICNSLMAYASSSGNIIEKKVEVKQDIPVYSLEEIILSAPQELHLVDKIKGNYGEITSDIVSQVFDFVVKKGQLTSKSVVYKVLTSKDWND